MVNQTGHARRPGRAFVLFFAFAVLVLATGGCGGGGGGSERGTVPGVTPAGGAPATSTAKAISVLANVVDPDGLPVQGATVVSGAQTFTTDASGAVAVPLDAVAGDGTPVRLTISRGGYVTGLSSVRVYPTSLNSNNIHEVTLTLHRLPATAADATEAVITNADGSTSTVSPVVTTAPDSGLPVTRTTVSVASDTRAVTFQTATTGPVPPSVSVTIGDVSGAGAGAAAVLATTGGITGSVVYGDPTDAADLGMFPGEFITNSDTGAGVGGQGTLVTAGFARVTLENESGTPITSFAPGTSISITMRIPPGVTNPETGAETAAGNTVPIFAFNESTGEWIVETNTDGSVKRATVQQDADGLFVVFPMTHLTWLNLDWKGLKCPDGTPRVTFKDAAGNPVSGVTINTRASGCWSGHPRYVKENFVAFTRAPRDVPWQVWGEKDGVQSNVATITACQDATIVFNTCAIACSTDAACDDGDINTFDTCTYANTCNASCKHTEVKCDLQLDKVNYKPGDTMQITLTASNAGTEPVYCGVETALKRDKDNPVWTSFDDDIYITIYPGQQSITRTLTKVIPNEWVGTDTNLGSDYDIYTLRVDRTRWARGDNFNIHVNKPCEMACASAADCNDGNPLTSDTCIAAGTCEAACSHTACAPVCSTDAACSDGNALTTDTCTSPGTCAAACSHTVCSAACSSDAACSDGNALTTDVCSNAGTCIAACTHTACTPACTSNADCVGDGAFMTGTCTNAGTCSAACTFSECSVACTSDAGCDDGNALTLDACASPNTCNASCTHSACTPACTANADCDDADALTTDACMNPNTCFAACTNTPCTPVCSNDAACNDGNALTIDTCTSPGTCTASCSNTSCSAACSSDAACNDGNPLTTDTCVNPGTCSAACSNTACTVACSNDTQCDDSNALTLDTCNNPGACASSCSNAACTPACANAADCDDSNPATSDTCNNAGTCSASCSNAACSVACSSDAACDDSNPFTTDTCTNPGTCGAMCSTTPCSVACFNDAGCDDSNALTTDTCNNPATCSAACSNTSCTPACSTDTDCDDSNPATTDVCNNAGTCFASCSITTGGLWIELGGSASGAGVSDDPGSELFSAMAVTGDCRPYVAWWGSSGMSMKYWDGAAWTWHGTSAMVTGAGQYPDLAINNSIVYIAFMSLGTTYNQIYLKKWNGTAWADLGGSNSGEGISNTAVNSQYPRMVLNNFGNPYIVWQDFGVHMKYWDGGAWQELGGSNTGTGISDNTNGSNPDITLDPFSNPVVTWVGNDGDAEIYLKRWNGSAWGEFASGTASGGGVSNDSVSSFNPSVIQSLSSPDTVFLTWENYGGVGGSSEIRVVKCIVSVGCSDITGNGVNGLSNDSGSSTSPEISYDANGDLVVAWIGTQNIYAKRFLFNQSVWEDMGTGSSSGTGVSLLGGYQPALSINNPGGPALCDPYLSWTANLAGSNNIYLKKWVP